MLFSKRTITLSVCILIFSWYQNENFKKCCKKTIKAFCSLLEEQTENHSRSWYLIGVHDSLLLAYNCLIMPEINMLGDKKKRFKHCGLICTWIIYSTHFSNPFSELMSSSRSVLLALMPKYQVGIPKKANFFSYIV